MKTINKNLISKSILLGLFFFVFSCETVELELLDDPDAISLSQSDLDFFLNSNEVTLAYFFEGMTEPGMEATRQIHMYGPLYRNGSSATLIWRKEFTLLLFQIIEHLNLSPYQQAFQSWNCSSY